MLNNLQPLPPDPILGLMTAFAQDSNPEKIDLGVGVYYDESSTVPIMAAVKEAEARLIAEQKSKTYLPPAGDMDFNTGILNLLLGENHQALTEKRASSIQTVGGCAALRVGAEVLKRSNPRGRIWVSNPSWQNHHPLLSGAGLAFNEYPYYDFARKGVDFDAMLSALKDTTADDIVLLHGCCHNPSGADLTCEQWRELTNLAVRNGFTPFIDIAYQGLGRGLDEDAEGLRWMASRVPEMLIASSCSKNFGIYRERTGALTLIAESTSQSQAAKSHAINAARQFYSMPSSHGAQIVGRILRDTELNNIWKAELETMRNRIASLRTTVTDKLDARCNSNRFDFIREQYGMFSFLGMTSEQVERLKTEFGIYMVNSARINIAGLNDNNMDYFVESVATVI